MVVGCGDIGYRVALILHRQGHQVTGIKRQDPIASSPIPIMTVDIRQASALSALPDDFDLVLFIVSVDSRQTEAYQALYSTGLNNLLSHFVRGCRVTKWLMVSSTSVYGQNRGEWVDEESEIRPASLSAQWLVAAENALWESDEANCVVRFSGIYGPGRDWLLRRASLGEPIQQLPPRYTNRIHRDDCVAVLSYLIEKMLGNEALQRCYLASDDDPAPIWDVMTWMAKQYAYPLPVPLVNKPDAEQNKRCDNTSLKSLGYRFLFPSYRDGYFKMNS